MVRRLVALALLAVAAAAQQPRLAVTVFDEKTGEAVRDLEARDFAVRDGRIDLQVRDATYKRDLLDIILLVDASLTGEMVRPLAPPMIAGLEPNEQMAVVAYDQSATLVQPFTSSHELLMRALETIEYGNNPRVLDALYAVLDGGFESAAGRRVVIVLTAGVEGSSRMQPADVLQLARRREVQIYFVYVAGVDSRLFEGVASNAGGAWFHARRLKLQPRELAERVYDVVRGRYELEVMGVAQLGRDVDVEAEWASRKGKIRATALPLE